MDRLTRRRFIAMFSLIAVMAGLFCFRLFKLQTADGDDSPLTAQRTIAYSTPVQAARGDILDRNGKVLVTNRASYDLSIVNLGFFCGDSPLEQIRTLVELLNQKGETIIDTLPVSMEKPYTYLENPTSAQASNFSAYLRWRDWDPEVSAKNLVGRMKELYRIPESWDDDLARQVLGVRYELDLRYCIGMDHYVMARDLSTDTLAAVKELGIPGVSVEASSVRTYTTPYAAHVLGRIAQMSPEEWETYKEKGYSMDALVGKEGLEAALEQYLHGENGTRTTVITDHGEILETYYTKEPTAGNNVSLTLDLNLQAAAEESLKDLILDLQENGVGKKKEGKDAKGGAVVAMEVATGEVLVSASYPTFDPATFSQDFETLSQDKSSPFLNRALNSTYHPGSIYKMVTAIAAMDEDNASAWRQITDLGVYTYYRDEGYTCNCHIWTSSGITHGTVNMMQALCVSCNYYFYEIGRLAGIDKLEKVAAGLGLGEKTGVELYEEKGTRANPETRKALYSGTDSAYWYGADTLQASIGQSDNRFTPIQMASYCATLANGGKRMKATFLRQVTSRDSSQLLYRNTPTVLSHYPISENAMLAIGEGMKMTASDYNGTAFATLGGYPVSVAAKTGTAQHGSGGSDNASLICFAPADDPKIAIAVYVENGAQGGNLGKVAKAVLDAYFAGDTALPQNPGEHTIS